MKSNILLKVLAGVGVFIVIVVVVVGKRSGTEEVAGTPQIQNAPTEVFDENALPYASPNAEQELANLVAIEQGPLEADNGLDSTLFQNEFLEKEYGVDVDSPVETMRTLTNETRAVREDSVALQDKLKAMQLEAQRLLDMEDTLNKRVESKFERAKQEAAEKQRELEHTQDLTKGLVERLERRLQELSKDGGQKNSGQATAGGYDIEGAGIPSGLGYDENGQTVNFDEVVWTNPMDAQIDDRDPNILSLPDFSLTNSSKALPPLANGPVRAGANPTKEDRLIKAYTIPANATLMGSTAMTALVGRIPTSGQVTDPYPFKIMIGEDNLSSNGIQIPGVVGIKMSGFAKGDWTMSCVSGQVYSMTFTFQDGSITTIPEPGTKASDPLAWLSDVNGIPCLTGKRITNAVSFLGSRILLSAAESFAAAEAAAEFTTSTNSDGGSTSTLTGDSRTVAKNAAIASGLSEGSEWLEERQENSFDAIYAPPGTDVNVHINEELRIDYDPEGRKVNHYASITTRSKNHLD